MIWSSTASCEEKKSTITITTDSDFYAGTSSIDVRGYGPLPESCIKNPDDTCTLELCDLDTLRLEIPGIDGWKFTITGDIGDLVDYELKDSSIDGYETAVFPTWLKKGTNDCWQTYDLESTSVVTFDVSFDIVSSFNYQVNLFARSPSFIYFIHLSFFESFAIKSARYYRMRSI